MPLGLVLRRHGIPCLPEPLLPKHGDSCDESLTRLAVSSLHRLRRAYFNVRRPGRSGYAYLAVARLFRWAWVARRVMPPMPWGWFVRHDNIYPTVSCLSLSLLRL